MKKFKEFLSESVNVSGNFNGNIYMNSSPKPQQVGEQFVADVIYQGSIHRISMTTKSGIPTRDELGEHLQVEYPGAIVQNIYSVSGSTSPYEITDRKRYHPAKLDWI